MATIAIPRATAAAPAAVRDRTRIAYGLAAVLAGGLVAALSVAQSGSRIGVVVAARPILAGQVIQAGDVRIARLNSDAAIASIKAGDRGQVVGATAVAGVPAGQVFTTELLGPASDARRRSVVGLLVKAGQAPSTLLRGDKVLVVVSSGTSGSSTHVLAEVVAVTRGQSQGERTVDLGVDPSEAVVLAEANAAGGRVSIVRAP